MVVSPSPRSPLPLITIGDELVRVDAFCEQDAVAVHAAAQDPEMMRWLAFNRAIESVAAAQAWTRECEMARRAGTGVRLAVRERASGQLWGCVELTVFSNGAGAVGYWTVPHARGQGVARRALKLLTEWALESAAVWALDLFTIPGNEASERVAVAAGYCPDGQFTCFDERVGGEQTFNVFAYEPVSAAADSQGGSPS
jgi:RimJ/RimL family protein N-acetyltransferase